MGLFSANVPQDVLDTMADAKRGRRDRGGAPSTGRDEAVTAPMSRRWSTVATVTASSAIRLTLGRMSASTAAPDHRKER
ncbi:MULTISPECIES: hypothetical protein [unclassified Mycobacterium]|uniref:hypothetical protein n=1 Tax=unclassified Mycobacterium TaxID=2642494 RepID=UPI00048AC805|nr:MULTISPECIES: hypothetical protein [unclassified Mycobacterium]